MALPTKANVAADTFKPVHMWAVITPDGGSAIEAKPKKMTRNFSISTIDRKVPQGDFLVADVTFPTTKEDSFTLEFEEFNQDVYDLAFGGSFTVGTCQIFATDPRDAAGDVKYKTDVFPCQVLPESGESLDAEALSGFSIKVVPGTNAVVTWNGLA
ncbi:hypothetical protein MLD52_09180 [Puniceicoccaceae bacterium K14]|nr:hypothetical protein [Puniceicoccaceae bacterium K14]